MGLATIHPHSPKVQTKFYKIPKFDVNRPKSKTYKEMHGHPDAVSDSVRMAMHFFVNFDVFKSLYVSQN